MPAPDLDRMARDELDEASRHAARRNGGCFRIYHRDLRGLRALLVEETRDRRARAGQPR